MDSVEIARTRDRLGMTMTTGCGLDALQRRRQHAQGKRGAVAGAVRRRDPRIRRFNAPDIERVRAQWLAGIAQEKTQPVGLALRTLPPLLYGDGHPYAIPFTGTGTEAGDQVADRAGPARVAGGMAAPGQRRASWSPATPRWRRSRRSSSRVRRLDAAGGAPRAARRSRRSRSQAKPRVFLIDKPGAQQSLILAGAARAADDRRRTTSRSRP